MIKAAIVGASGYTGAELVRLLDKHPKVDVVALTSESYAGQKLSELYPALGEAGNKRLKKLDELVFDPAAVDVVFLGVPHGESMNMTPEIVKTGVKVIDLSGDFRFKDTLVYEKWYERQHTAKNLAAQATYGLPELFRQSIKGADFVANPGCYVTATVLALYPLIKAGWVEPTTLVADAKSGISGAGRKATAATMFNRVSENIMPYKVGGAHQHIPEMETALSQATGEQVVLSFSPQLIPAKRGILTTTYAQLKQDQRADDLQALFQETYRNEPFVRVQAEYEAWPDLSMVVGSNNCVIKTMIEERTQKVITIAAIDNLIKGASGQAIQNMNLLVGEEEVLGLPLKGMIP